MKSTLSPLLLQQNSDYAEFLKASGTASDNHLSAGLFNTKMYAEFLFNGLNTEEEKQDFVSNCVNLLQAYSANMFWLDEAKQTFNYLISEIKKGQISLDSVHYFLPVKKMMQGFTLSIKEHIASVPYNQEREEKRLQRLAKEQQLDKIIMILIQQQFSIMSNQM